MLEQKLNFSVVVPTYNRPSQLRKCLEGLANQHYPSDAFEVIVVDDGSTQPLTGIQEIFRGGPQFFLLSQKNAGQYRSSARERQVSRIHG
jgi:glycosyltransferase involved in cell wall biosynthesis